MRQAIRAFLLLVFLSGCSRAEGPVLYDRTETMMGTFVQVKVSAPGLSRAELSKLVDGALGEARETEKSMSSYDPESEINRINAAAGGEASEELFRVIAESIRISAITGGEFDVTVSPILKADGFYAGMPRVLLESIPDTLEGVGWKNIKLSGDGKTIGLDKGAWLDLSGIAKGYIVDRMADGLKIGGAEEVMVNAGGDIYCGVRGRGGEWRIGIREPGGGTVVLTLEISEAGIATSGDYENVVEDRHTGKMIAHIIDPSREEAIPELFSSVTVIAPTCAEADALATGMMAMGPDRAQELADRLEGIEMIYVEGKGPAPVITLSAGADAYIGERGAR